MNTMAALTIVEEDIEQTVLKMIKANLEEYEADKNKAVTKFMKKALELKTKAHNYINENMDEVIRTFEFSLKGGK